MGASFETFYIKKDLSKNEAVAKVKEHIEQCRWEDGNGGYTGTMAEARGVEVASHITFQNWEEAEDWLDGYAEKWGPAVLVRVNNAWLAGAICSS